MPERNLGREVFFKYVEHLPDDSRELLLLFSELGAVVDAEEAGVQEQT